MTGAPFSRRAGTAVAVVAGMLLLGGCVSIPAQGPVVLGRNIADDRSVQRPPRLFVPGPIGGESPQEVAQGFIRAAVDYSNEHEVARSWLATDSRSSWNPDQSILVYQDPLTITTLPPTAASGSAAPTASSTSAATASPTTTAHPSGSPSSDRSATVRPGSTATVCGRPSSTSASAGSGSSPSASPASSSASPSATSSEPEPTLVHPTQPRVVPTPAPVVVDGETAVVEVCVPVAATIVGQGIYQLSDGTQSMTEFLHLRVENGEWRIVDPPRGVLIPRSDFSTVFGRVRLYFPDRTGRWLVPDVRWFPLGSSLSVVVDALLGGPAPWLSDAVRVVVPAGTNLTTDNVRVDASTVTVDLTKQALAAKPEDRQLFRAQLAATLDEAGDLSDVAVSQVKITVEQRDFEIVPGKGPDLQLAAAATVDSVPVVMDKEGRVARLVGDSADAVDGLGRLSSVPGASHPAVSPDGSRYAVLGTSIGDRTVTRLFVAVKDGEPEQQLVDSAMTAPSFDRFGWVWTAPAGAKGSVFASRGDRQASVAAADLSGYTVVSFRLSREGARALVVATKGGVAYAFVLGVRRATDGAPLALAGQTRLLTDLRTAQDAAWVDDTTVAVLGSLAEAPTRKVWFVQIGGQVNVAPAVTAPDAIAVTVGGSPSELWLATGKGIVTPPTFGRSALLAGLRWPAVPG